MVEVEVGVVVMLVVLGVLVVLEEVEAAVVQQVVDTPSEAARERPLQQQAPPLGQHQ